VINRSLNETLSRTILTSGLTLLSVIALFLFGGSVLHNFAFALLVGMIAGVYSTVFIASPVLILWDNYRSSRKAA
jgi:preprotein translocase subunit SecF